MAHKNLVGIFDAEQELAAGASSEQVIEQCGTKRADMEVARRRGCETRARRRVRQIIVLGLAEQLCSGVGSILDADANAGAAGKQPSRKVSHGG